MGWGKPFRRAERSVRKALSDFDDSVLHPVKEGIQDITGKVTALPFDALKAIAPDELQGSWMSEIPALMDPGKQLEKEYWEKPAETFVNEFDQASSIMPRATRQYAPAIATTALSAFNPLAGAAFSTAYAAGKNQQQGGDWDWEDVGRDAVVNFGAAALGEGANKFFSSPARQGVSLSVDPTVGGFSGAAPAGSTLNTSSLLADSGKSALSGFTNQAPAAMNLTRASLAEGATSTPARTQSGLQKFASNVTSNMGGGEIANLMYPKAVAIGGNVGDNGEVAQGATAESDRSAYDIFNPGNTVFDQASYEDMLSRIYANYGLQHEGMKDLFRESGRWALSGQSDTPFGRQESDITRGLNKTVIDASQEFKDRAALSAIEKANPQFYNDQADTNYWLNEAKSGYAPKPVMDTFGSYTKYAQPIPNFQSYWAPKPL